MITVTVIVTVTATDDSGEYHLDQLTTRVAEEIGRLGMEQSNGQVASVPDGRTLRYYASLGLLDKPVEVRGRRAIYGERHVLQAVAVKALQAQGLSLGEIQLRLNGRSDAELRALLARPDGVRFWRRPPAPAGPETAGADTGTGTPGPHAPHAPPDPTPAGGDDGPEPGEPTALRLAPGALLLVEGLRAPTADDAAAVRRAAAELLDELRRRDLINPAIPEGP